MKAKAKKKQDAQPSQILTRVSPDEIALCAYEIWEQEGRPVGREMDHWLQAEAQHMPR